MADKHNIVPGLIGLKIPIKKCKPYPRNSRERLAEYAHDAWAGWMRYLFSKSAFNADGSATIPKWAVDRCQGQVATDYKNLPESEMDSDRKEADAMLAIMEK